MLNNTQCKAAAAIKVSLLFGRRPSFKLLYSPVCLKKSYKEKEDQNSKIVFVTSTVGIVHPQRAKVLPISVTLSIGETLGLTPPSLSFSAKLRQMRISYRVSPPREVDINRPSGSKVFWNPLKVDSISFTQCIVIFDTIKSN